MRKSAVNMGGAIVKADGLLLCPSGGAVGKGEEIQ